MPFSRSSAGATPNCSAPRATAAGGAEAEIRNCYTTVGAARRTGDIVLIKTLLYTGVHVAELVKIRIDNVDLDACRIRIAQGKGGKTALPRRHSYQLALQCRGRSRSARPLPPQWPADWAACWAWAGTVRRRSFPSWHRARELSHQRDNTTQEGP
ncbi:hypothetical protein GCM10020219_011930 [Nonomuraea dietziae]